MKWLWAALLTLSGVVSANAYTCADVRSLSAAQQAYYIKVYSITPAQQELIRHACYEPKGHHATVTVEAATGQFGRGQRDARAGQ
jgi:hypothetical protein